MASLDEKQFSGPQLDEQLWEEERARHRMSLHASRAYSGEVQGIGCSESQRESLDMRGRHLVQQPQAHMGEAYHTLGSSPPRPLMVPLAPSNEAVRSSPFPRSPHNGPALREDDEDDGIASVTTIRIPPESGIPLPPARQSPTLGGKPANGVNGEAVFAQNGVESEHGTVMKAVAGKQGKVAVESGQQGEHVAGQELLTPIPEERQLSLEFNHISSWVSLAFVQKPSLAKRAKNLMACGKGDKATADGEGGKGKGSKDTLPISSTPVSPKDGKAVDKPKVEAASPPVGGKRQVLHDISGRVTPGQVLALMGPSGSGKTSLLSCIGGRIPKLITVDGEVLVNGLPFTKATRRRIGFVLQDDTLFETLTVYETLLYSGLLRLPADMPRTEKVQRVNGVMSVLGIAKSKDTIIGGFFRRGISGGERKRVSVGSELLTNPAVILLDEPTSGLDSTTAMHLVTLLRQLAQGGRALLTTIHQPSSRLYRQLDQVMLLAEGHVMYAGDALKAVEYFEHLGFQLPYGVNVADFILDCATGEVEYDPERKTKRDANISRGSGSYRGSRQRQSGSGNSNHSALPPAPATADEGQVKEDGMTENETIVALYTTFENWYRSHPEGFQDSYAIRDLRLNNLGAANSNSMAITSKSTATPGVAPPYNAASNTVASSALYTEQGGAARGVHQEGYGETHGGGNGKPTPMDVEAGGHGAYETKQQKAAAEMMSDKRDGATYWEQLKVLSTRTIKVRRFESLSGQNIMQLLGVAIITGLLWWQRGGSQNVSAAVDVQGLLFFELLFPSFRSLFSALFTFPNEFRILSKERPSGMYRLSAYYFARTAADLPIEIIYPVIFSAIVYWFGGLRAEAGAFIANMVSLILVVLIAQSWGLLFGGTFMDPKMAQTVTTVVMLTFLLIGGYYVRSVPVWISWIKYISFVYWGYNLLLKVQFRHNQYFDCSGGAASVAGVTVTNGPCVPVTDLKRALALPVNPNDSVWLDVVVLLAMLFVLRALTYYVLRVKTADKGAITGGSPSKKKSKFSWLPWSKKA